MMQPVPFRTEQDIDSCVSTYERARAQFIPHPGFQKRQPAVFLFQRKEFANNIHGLSDDYQTPEPV